MDLDTRKHKAMVRVETARRAKAYSNGSRPGESVGPMIDLALPKPADRMLDVACGAGMVALAFAKHVNSVVGIDITEEMVELARKRAAEQGVANAAFIAGDAERLRFDRGLFDLVTCRSSFHLLLRADKALHHMARVLAKGGRIVVYDLVTSEDPQRAERHNAIMRLRNPSHVKMLSPSQWSDFVRQCGLHVAARTIVMMKRDFGDWMDMVGADDGRRAQVRAALVEAADGDAAGLGVRVRGDSITFSQTCGIWLLTK